MAKSKKLPTGTRHERVVVDEIFDDGIVRFLRASRNNDNEDIKDFSIHAWGDEKEDFIESWRMEAFVGYSRKQRLREGDVFFIADGKLLNSRYKPIPRDKAAKEHLLVPVEKSIETARNDIKKQYYKLAAINMSVGEKDEKSLIKKVESKFQNIQQAQGEV